MFVKSFCSTHSSVNESEVTAHGLLELSSVAYFRSKQHMWQFHVEFEDDSVAYFGCITTFEVPSDY